jgi:hypothetical protein
VAALPNPNRSALRQEPASSRSREELDVPLSPAAKAMLEAGLASAKRGEIKPMGDFTQYVDSDDD